MEAGEQRVIEILLVEDNLGDIELTRHSLERVPGPTRLHVARDGVEGLRFLRREAEFAQAPRPDLILLDLNLPRLDGHEVLLRLKTDPHLLSIPVVVLTTSRAEHDIRTSYRLYANAYISKPPELGAFVARLRQMQSFWFDVATLPSA